MIIRGYYQVIAGKPSVVGRIDGTPVEDGIDDWPIEEGDLMLVLRGGEHAQEKATLFGLHGEDADSDKITFYKTMTKRGPILFSLALLALLLAGCASSRASRCEASGGTWVKLDFPYGYQCVRP